MDVKGGVYDFGSKFGADRILGNDRLQMAFSLPQLPAADARHSQAILPSGPVKILKPLGIFLFGIGYQNQW